MDYGYCLAAKILESQGATSDEHSGGARSAGHSVAWGKQLFGGAVV
jgi:hypothetical protein